MFKSSGSPFVSNWRNVLNTVNSVKLDPAQKKDTYISPFPHLNKFNKFKKPQEIEERISVEYHTNNFSPVCFADNPWNEHQALKSRVTVTTPMPDMAYLRDFRADIKANHKIIIPGMKAIKTNELLQFQDKDKALKKYPELKPVHAVYLYRSNARPSVKRTLLKGFLELYKLGIDEDSYLSHKQLMQMTMRSSFLKMENLLYRTLCGIKRKAPRFISGAQATFINLVAPWMMACQDRLKLSWGVDHFITFSSGKTNEQIGAICEKNLDKSVFEDDIGVFDSSVCPELLKVELDLFKSWGAPRAVAALVKTNINTRGKTKWGFAYKVKGTRKSGDPYTSLGNSLLNGLLHYYAYKTNFKLKTREVMKQLKMIVQGDDNLGFATRKMDWQSWMARAGFSSEAINRSSIYEATFCSSRIYPTKDGLVMGPCPGKVLAKFGYFVDKPPQVTGKQLLRGSALGLYKQCHFIPPIKIYLDKVLEYTKGEKAYFTKRGDWMTRTEKLHDPCPQTYELLHKHYGWRIEYDKHFKDNLPMHPKHISFPYLETMMDLDHSGPKVFFR
jgi:hypothetical protein